MSTREKTVDPEVLASATATAAAPAPAAGSVPAAEAREGARRAERRAARVPLWIVSAGSIVLLLGLWWGVTAAGLIPALYLPSPRAVLAKLYLAATEGYADATLGQHLAASLGRVLAALLAAVLTAIPLGVAIGVNRVFRAAVDPLIELYRPVPPLAYLPLIVIWFGIGELSKVLLIYLAIFAPVALTTAAGVRAVDPIRVRVAQSLGATRGQVIRHVILPSALPDILTGVRIGLGAGWSTLIAAELIAATRGIGFMIQTASQFLVTDLVIAGIVVIAVVAYALDLSLRLLQRRFAPWWGRESS
jgi:taurine transport system permease protein